MIGVLRTVWLCSLMMLPGMGKDRDLPIRFGLIADIQYGDCDPGRARFYRNALVKLDECIAKFNAEHVDFTINLGDSSDRNFNDLSAVAERFSKLSAPIYNTTGNHDYKGVTDNDSLFRKLGMPAEYYVFTKNGWRFVMLNTNEVAPYSNCEGTWKENELNRMKASISSGKKNNGAAYNGGISSRQLQWLVKQLETAGKNRENVLIFSHHPLYPAMGLTALNDSEILDVLSKASCVKAIVSGHHHTGAYGTYKGIPCITLEGMIETEKDNAYALVEIDAGGITITGFGRASTYRIPLRGGTTMSSPVPEEGN